jgi:hypothetical protein
MPVNMDPSKKRRTTQPAAAPPAERELPQNAPVSSSQKFGEETAIDREKDMADAEWKNLWDATEVIDMDKI